jgi:anti-sigma factor RsiW
VGCRWCEYVSGYVDDELDPEERAWFREHLACCEECRRDLLDFRALAQLIDALRDSCQSERFGKNMLN